MGDPAFVFVVLLILAFGPVIDLKTLDTAGKGFSALLTPLIAGIAVFIALQQRRIAQQQARTAKRKLRYDTFDKRYAVFEALLAFISTVLGKASLDPQDLYNTRKLQRSPTFSSAVRSKTT